jgi:hypothetical protein
MKLVTTYQISAIDSCWEKCDIVVSILDPSDSYFLFADLVGFYTHWTYMRGYHKWALAHSSSLQEVGIWRVKKRYPQYGIPIWSLWPHIRFLPSIVAEKNATKNILDGRTDRWTEHIFRRIFLSNYWWQESDIWSQASYRYPISW